MRNTKSNKGFTLIELLIVIAIIGILAAVLIPNLLSARQRANTTAGQAYVRNVATEIEARRQTDGTFATTGDNAVGDTCISLVANSPGVVADDACEVDLTDGGLNYTIEATLTGASVDQIHFIGETGILADGPLPAE